MTATPAQTARPAAVRAIVVMGVAASGKSTIAEQLARALQWDFLEGDRLHSATSMSKLRHGEPLTDADRWPWLAAIGAWMTGRLDQGRRVVVACSALRRVYRDRLREAAPGVHFVYLRVSRAVLEQRARDRRHFMPPSLLDSQLATLEEPSAEPDALIVDGDREIVAIVAAIRTALAL